MAGPVLFYPLLSPAPAWAAAEPTPASPVTPPKSVWRSVDWAIPVALLTPVAHAPASLVAPSYAGWLTDPPHAALPGRRFVARGPVTTEIEVFERVASVSPPASASVPLPPKRLAEKRSVVLASLAPLPPKRLLELMPAEAQTTAVPEPPPIGVTASADATVSLDADAPQVDAARPIDDSPEPAASRPTADRAPAHIEAVIQRHADRFDVPASLVRRVAWRESKFDPKRRHGPYWGLMQIRVDTARGLGFRGAPNDLLDADTNMTYAAAYLANAYRVAGRDEKRAVTLYAKGYYYEAKRKRMLDSLIRTAAAEK